MPNKPKVSDPDRPRTLDEARTRISELKARLGGKTPAEPSGSVTALQKPIAKPTAAVIKQIVSAASAFGSLPTLEAISRELKGEDSSSARIQYLNGVAADYQKAITAARKAKDYALETSLFRSLHRISKRQAEELRADPEAWKNILKTPPSDL
jgi:hypothetical protein